SVEVLDELAVAVPQQVLGLHRLLVEYQGHVASLLYHPRPIGVGRHPREMDAPAAHMDEERDEHLDQARPRPHLLGEEVAGPECVPMSLEKLVPGALPTAWARIQAIIGQVTVHPGQANRRMMTSDSTSRSLLEAPLRQLVRHLRQQRLIRRG